MKTMVITLLSIYWLNGQNLMVPHQYTVSLKSDHSNQGFGQNLTSHSPLKSII